MSRPTSFLVAIPVLAAAFAVLPACSTFLGFEELSPAPEDAAVGQDGGADAGDPHDGASDAGDPHDGGSEAEASGDAAEDAAHDSGDAPAEAATDAPDDHAVSDAAVDGPDEGGCGDTTSNPEHCGSCGHDCLGGDCAQGMCQPFVLATIHDGARGLAVDDTRVYLAVQLNNEIARVDKQSGAVLSYDTDSEILVPAWISVGATSMVWSNRLSGNGSVASCPKTGCQGNAPTVLVSPADRPNGVLVDGDTLYWVETYAGTVNKAKVGDGSGVVELVAASLGYEPFRLAHSGGYLYFTEVSSSGRVVRVNTNGGPAVVLGTSASPAGIAVTEDTVYWADSQNQTGRILSVPNADPPGGGPVTTDVAIGQDVAFSVVADQKNVYWVASATSTTANGAVRYCPRAGCPSGGPVTLASGLAYPIDIAVDERALYVSIFGLDSAVDGAVVKIAKP